MTKKRNSYLGKAGHLAMMSEFLIRGWNVAIPEVDIGDDIYVVEDENGTLRRVQVKTSTATPLRHGFSGQFNIPLRQLINIKTIPIHYAFIFRNEGRWESPLIVRQDYLQKHVEDDSVGSKSNDAVMLRISVKNKRALCSKVDFTQYVDNFEDFPSVEH